MWHTSSNNEENSVVENQRIFSYFKNLVGFMRYHIEEVLPRAVPKSGIPDELFEECENLLITLRNFMRFDKNMKPTVELWKDVLFEMDVSASERKGHYCGLCHFATYNPSDWSEHAKTHSDAFETSCRVCGLVLQADGRLLNTILKSDQHKILDQKVKAIKNKACRYGSTLISDGFQYLNSTLDDTTERHFCQPCGLIFDKKDDFSNHCSTIKHPGNTISACKNCRMTFLGYKLYAGDYMGYHLRLRHPEKWSEIINESNRSKKTPDPNPKFVEILKAKREEYDATKIQSFQGLCLNCDRKFSCQFEWVSHTDEHRPKSGEETVECENCNLGLFGDKETIKSLYLENPEHIFLDQYMQE